MKILIAKQSEEVIKQILPKVKFVESTKNTTEFIVSEKTFHKLYREVKTLGYNPHAFMAWYLA